VVNFLIKKCYLDVNHAEDLLNNPLTIPPSTCMVVPVIPLAFSEDRNATRSASSQVSAYVYGDGLDQFVSEFINSFPDF